MVRLILAVLLLLSMVSIVNTGCTGERSGEMIVVVTLDASEITGTSAKLNGRLTEMESQRVNVRFLWCEYSGELSDWNTAEVHATEYQQMTSTGDFSAVITGLEPDHSYSFFAAFSDHNFQYFFDIYQRPKSFICRNEPFLAIKTLKPTMITSVLVTLSGELVDMKGASSVEVYFEWGESPGSYTHETERQTMTTPGIFSAQILGNMTIGKTYYYRARAGTISYGYEESFYVP